MKSLVPLLAGLVLIGGSQHLEAKDKAGQRPHVYNGIANASGVTADELFVRAKDWVVFAYNLAPAVIHVDEPQNHMLVLEGQFRIAFGNPKNPIVEWIWHRLAVETKDGSYRFTLDGFERRVPGASSVPVQYLGYKGKQKKAFLTELDAVAKSTIQSLRFALVKPAAGP